MTNEPAAMLAAIEEQLTFTDDEGVVLEVAVLGSVYFEQPHTRAVREAVVDCCEDYFRRFGEHLRWALDPEMNQMERFGQGEASRPRMWVTDVPEKEGWSVHYHSGEWDLGVAKYSLGSFCPERQPYPQLGYLRISLPVSEICARPQMVVEVMLGICRRLRPISGYAGIGMVECEDYGRAARYQSIVYELAQRFPGLEVDDPLGHARALRQGDGIKGGNWLTIVGDRFLARLGGADAVSAELAALDSRFAVHRFDGGVLIQAGPRPELGAVELDDWPVLYVKLAKLLKPIRVTSLGSLHMGGAEPRFNRETTEAWLRRFDDR